MDQVTGCAACGRPIIHGALQCQYCGAKQPPGAPPVPPTAPVPPAPATAPAGAFCRACGRPSDPAASFCASCGAPTSPHAANAKTAAESAVTYHALVLIAGLLLAIGPFLPWLSLGMLSASGIQKTGGEAWALVLVGGVAVVAAIVSIATKRPRVHAGLIVLAVIGGALSWYYFHAMGENIAEVNEKAAAFGGEATFGAGLFMSCGGAALLLIFTIIGALPTRQRA